VNGSLVLAGLALGAAATPHCALMCGAPCAAVVGGRARAAAWFQLGRLAGYAAGGAVAGGAVALLGAWMRATPWLAPLWTLVQAAFLGLGLWWLATGRMPAPLLRARAPGPGSPAGSEVRIVATPVPWRAAGAGLAWVAWPCGVLQGALLLAALGGGAVAGAAVMAAFALASGPALLAAPGLWAAWRRWAGRGPAGAEAIGWRIAGAALSLAAALALAHTLRERVAALCQG